MQRVQYIIILLLTCMLSAEAATTDAKRAPSYVAVGANIGTVLQTCDYFSGNTAIPLYASESIKYIFTSPGDKWQQVAYGMPYYGVGVATTQFGKPHEIGNPLSIYLVQGATMHKFRKGGLINYELNLGLSTNWRPYDPFTNRENTAIGSVMNVHVAANIYYKWYLSKKIDLNLGASIFHASNGSSKQPNLGMNTASAYFELVYNFDREQQILKYNPDLKIPHFDEHFEHDIQMILSSTNRKIKVGEDEIPNGFNDREFDIYGLNYYLMRSSSYKYKYGIGAELLYDESSNANMYRKFNPIDGKVYEVTDLAPFKERLSLGLTVRGEIVRPLYSIFANIGYSIIQPSKNMDRVYQSVGVKIPLQNNLYGTFGVRATNFSQAQFLYWSLGYTFQRK